MERARARRQRKVAEPRPAETVVGKVAETVAETAQTLGEVVKSAAGALAEVVAPEANPPARKRGRRAAG